MKSFKETFNLIERRVNNLNGIIKQSEYCIENNMHVDYYQEKLTEAIQEKENLLTQENQLRDFIIKDK